jgi:release factor glutamine methyltransferase
MRNFIKKVTHPFLRIVTEVWFSKPRKYTYKNISVLVHPEVFPPHYTISTKILLDFIDKINLKGKTFLELGCGSGILSLFAASKGAKVTATDINTKAITYLQKASKENNIPITVLHSDLFSKLKNQYFNYIIINPPYYPKSPENQKEKAWFCGENFEYFKDLFQQLSARNSKEIIYMILSEDCKIDKIESIAKKYDWYLDEIFRVKKLQEINYIFEIKERTK